MTNTRRVTTIAVVLASAVTLAANPQSAINTPQWKVLFDGTSLDAWRGYKSDAVPDGWRIENGTLTKDRPVKDIVSKDEFGDFDLEIEWKIGEAGNSGIFYRGSEEFDHIYWSAPARGQATAAPRRVTSPCRAITTACCRSATSACVSFGDRRHDEPGSATF